MLGASAGIKVRAGVGIVRDHVCPGPAAGRGAGAAHQAPRGGLCATCGGGALRGRPTATMQFRGTQRGV
eukprot:8250182-Alexandrium_andersonii.AAC.1